MKKFRIPSVIFISYTVFIIMIVPMILSTPVTVRAGSSEGEKSISFGSGFDDTTLVALGDLNGDNCLDIVSAVNMGDNILFINDSTGNSYSNVVITNDVMDMVYSLGLGDVNGDNHTDIVIGKFMGQHQIYINDSIGNSYTAVDYPVVSIWAMDCTDSVALGDMNGDGYLDIVHGNDGVENVVYFNDGAGNFDDYYVFSTASSTRSIALGDMDGDNDLDIVMGNNSEVNLVCLNNGSGDSYTRVEFGPGDDDTYSVTAGDMNNDGSPDIVAANNFGQNVVYLNDGTGLSYSDVAFGTPGTGAYSVALADMDGEGSLDIVTGNYMKQNYVYLNDGTGLSYSSVAFGADDTNTQSIALGDMDNDHDIDIVEGNSGQYNNVYFNQSIDINLKQGDTDLTGGYDYGPVMNTASSNATFTIENLGTWDLKLTTPFTLSGNNTDQFSIVEPLTSIIKGSENTTFTACFHPTTPGVKTATVTINSNDPEKSSLNLLLTGTGIPGQEMDVMGNAVSIPSGDTEPSVADGTDFGSVNITGDSIVRDFTICNTGVDNLTLTGNPLVSITGAVDFSVTSQLETLIEPGDNTTFQITFTPTFLGTRMATVSIPNDDPDEDPYTFTVKGAVTTTEANQPPDQPVNISPENSAGNVTLTLTLQSSNFSDSNAGDYHTASRWQITDAAGNYSSPVYDSGTDTTAKTQISVPAKKLHTDTMYYWHVRYRDFADEWSEWSAESCFTTSPFIHVPKEVFTIQSAVDFAFPGEEIVVGNGTYKECINIAKPLTLRSENGPDSTRLNSASDNTVIYVNADNVTVSGFSVAGANGLGAAAIRLDHAGNCTVMDNYCSDCTNGISVDYSTGSSVLDNTCTGIYYSGICTTNSSSTVIAGNICKNNGLDGISLFNSTDTFISGNMVESNEYDGIYILNALSGNISVLDNTFITDGFFTDNCSGITAAGNLINGKPLMYHEGGSSEVIDGNGAGQVVLNRCTGVTITGCNITGTDNAIHLERCNACRVYDNACSSNREAGIYLTCSVNNTIECNTCNSNRFSGIFLWDSNCNTVRNNNCKSNSYSGMLLTQYGDTCCNNTLYLNNFFNTDDVFYDEFGVDLRNTWYSPEKMSYLYRGIEYTGYLGNHYSDYTGTDTDNNSIGNTELPYLTVKGDQDDYPLTAPVCTVMGITREYDGTTNATGAFDNVVLAGILDGDEVYLDTSNATAVFTDSSPGTVRQIVASGMVLCGKDCDKYLLVQTGFGEITVKNLTVAGITVLNKVYDGSSRAAADFTGAKLEGVAAGDNVTLNTANASAAFSDPSRGIGKTVLVSGLTLEGADAGYYDLVQPVLTADIRAADTNTGGVTPVTVVEPEEPEPEQDLYIIAGVDTRQEPVAQDSEGNPLNISGGFITVSGQQDGLTVNIPVFLEEGSRLGLFTDAAGLTYENNRLVIPAASASVEGKTMLRITDETGDLGTVIIIETGDCIGSGDEASAEVMAIKSTTGFTCKDFSAENPSLGEVASTVSLDLFTLPDGARVTISTSLKPDPEAGRAFQLAATGTGMGDISIAYTINVEKTNLQNGIDIQNAVITMVVGKEWVNANGGTEAIHIIRYDPETGNRQVLNTQFSGYDSKGRMIFEGISPDGLSVFCLAGTKANEITEEPAVDEGPVIEDEPTLEQQPVDEEDLPVTEKATVIDDRPEAPGEDLPLAPGSGLVWWGWLIIGITGSAIIAAMYLYWKNRKLSP